MPILVSVSIVGLVCAAAAGAAAWFLHRDQMTVSAWPTATGVVLESMVRHTSAETFDRHRQLAWMPFVKYQYVVEGKPFSSQRISAKVYREFAQTADSPPSAKVRVVIERYPVGASVIVHYNPKSPAVAILEIDRSGNTLLLLLAAGFGLLSAACLLAWILSRAN